MVKPKQDNRPAKRKKRGEESKNLENGIFLLKLVKCNSKSDSEIENFRAIKGKTETFVEKTFPLESFLSIPGRFIEEFNKMNNLLANVSSWKSERE
jgi:hypothetical protein